MLTKSTRKARKQHGNYHFRYTEDKIMLTFFWLLPYKVFDNLGTSRSADVSSLESCLLYVQYRSDARYKACVIYTRLHEEANALVRTLRQIHVNTQLNGFIQGDKRVTRVGKCTCLIPCIWSVFASLEPWAMQMCPVFCEGMIWFSITQDLAALQMCPH